MKKRYVFILIFLITMFGAGYMGYNFLRQSSSVGLQGIHLVPKDAVFIIETNEAVENWKKISTSEPWAYLKQNELFKEITENASALDTLLFENESVIGDFGSREVVVSAHLYTPHDYDFLYIVDLQNVSKLKPVFDALIVGLKGFRVTKRTHNDIEVYQLMDKKTNEILYLSIVENLMVCSYTHTLVENAIDQREHPVIARDLSFLEVQKEVRSEGMFRVYLQYEYFDEYMNVYLDNENPYITEVSKALKYTGLSFDYYENNSLLAFEGKTNLTPEMSTYMQLVQKDRGSKISFPEVVPKRAAIVTSLNLRDFEAFYEGLEEQMKTDEKAYVNYREKVDKIENFLKISLKKDFISWIDDELCFVQTQPVGLGKENEYALFIKANDIDEAEERLNFIGNQIKKRTPVKFKGVTYNEHEIKFLSVKGLFKVLMGSFFGKIEKPYYTIINDYVVFSNHPQTLKNIIDDFENGEVLEEDDDFKTFEKNLNNKSSFLIYVNAPVAYNSLTDMANRETKQDVAKNANYFNSFPFFAVQLTSESGWFDTKILLNYQPIEEVKENLEQIKEDSKDKAQKGDKFGLENDGETEKLSLKQIEETALIEVSEIVLDDLDVKQKVDKYGNGKVKYEVGVKNGVKHGSYTEYSENGNVIVKGKYKNDQKSGLWKWYNEKGDLIQKKRF